jgi:NAD-dependent deacetylase
MRGIDQAVELIRSSRRVVVMTGAGVSAESGVPTFRDDLTGYWSMFDPNDLATPEAFDRDPATVSRWYDERRQRVLACRPNAAHVALASWEGAVVGAGGSFVLLTQNVDRLHQRAGSRHVVELHGSLLSWRCTRTGRVREDLPLPLPHYPMESEAGGLYRPGVVWFGEMLPESAVARAEAAVASCDLVVSIGTSAQVYPAAGFVEWAVARGVRSLEVNRDPTPISELVEVSLRGLAGELLPRLGAGWRGGTD